MPPGQEGKITLAINHTEGYAGEVAKQATVTSNDPALPTFNLILRAHFKVEQKPGQPPSPLAIAAEGKRVGPFGVVPNDRWVAGVLRGTSAQNTLNLINREANPVHVTKVIPGGNGFSVQLQPIEDGKRYALVVTTDPALKPGLYTQTAKVLTDSPAAPEIPIQLEVTVYPLVIHRPNVISLQNLPFSVDLSALSLPSIYVQKARGGTMKIKRVESSLPFINLEVSPEVASQLFTIKIKLDKSKIKSPGEFRGAIRIETTDDETPLIEIPVQGSFN